MRRPIGVLAGVAIAASLALATPARAATEIGSDCVANASQPGDTILGLAKAPGSVLPLTAPSAGVLTWWTVRVGPSMPIENDPQKLEVFRSMTNPGKLQNVGESAEETVVNGTSKFKTRIPVLAGDRLGLYGPLSPGTLGCNTGSAEDEMGVLHGPAPLNSANVFPPVTKFQVPVSATLEPDLDGDGYGDETQDACPQSAAYQGECPRATLDTVPVVGKRSVTLLVTSNLSTFVSVREARKRAGRYLGAPRNPTLGSAPTPVAPGTIVPIKLRFYRSMIETLKSLSPKKSMTLRLKVFAFNLTGGPTVETLAVKVRGQKKPTRRR